MSWKVQENKDNVFTNHVILSGLQADVVKDKSTNSTVIDISQKPLPAEIHLTNSSIVEPKADVSQSDVDSLVVEIAEIMSKQATEFQYYKEIEGLNHAEDDVDRVYPLRMGHNRLISCYYSQKNLQLTCGSSNFVIPGRVTAVAVASGEAADFAVAVVDPTSNVAVNLVNIYSLRNILPGNPGREEFVKLQQIPLSHTVDAAALTLSNQSCFLFADGDYVPIYCRSVDSDDGYRLRFNLSAAGVRQVSVCYSNDGARAPLVAVRSDDQPGISSVVIWTFDGTMFRVMNNTIVTNKISDMDCSCDAAQCLLATLSPSKPPAIPGSVIIWR